MTNITKPELKPCPFCGSPAHFERIGNTRQSNIVECDSCGVTVESNENFNHGTAWNARAPQWHPIEGLPESEGEYLARQGKEVFHIKRMPDGRVSFRTHGRRNPISYRTIKVQLDGKEVDARVMLSEGPEVYEHNWCFWTSGFDFKPTHWLPLPEAPGVE